MNALANQKIPLCQIKQYELGTLATIGSVLQLVQPEDDWTYPLRPLWCTKHNRPPMKGHCTNHHVAVMVLNVKTYVPTKQLYTKTDRSSTTSDDSK